MSTNKEQREAREAKRFKATQHFRRALEALNEVMRNELAPEVHDGVHAARMEMRDGLHALGLDPAPDDPADRWVTATDGTPGQSTVWIFEPTRDEWVAAVYSTLEEAMEDLGITEWEVKEYEGRRFVEVGHGYVGEFVLDAGPGPEGGEL